MHVYYVENNIQRFKVLSEILAKYLNCEVKKLLPGNNKVSTHDIIYPWYFFNQESYPFNVVVNPPYIYAKYWDSKINQYLKLSRIIQTPQFDIYKNKYNFLLDLKRMKKKYHSFVVTSEFSENGNSIILGDSNLSFFKFLLSFNLPGKIRISEYLEVKKNISIHSIIANQNDIFIAPIVEQKLDGFLFRGGKYPSKVSISDENKISNFAYKTSEFLAQKGYRGICQMDLMITEDNIYLAEINPRKAGTTICVSCMMEQQYNYSLPVLEYLAVKDRNLPEVKRINNKNFSWELTYIPYKENVPDLPGDERGGFINQTSKTIIYNDSHKKWSYEIKVKPE